MTEFRQYSELTWPEVKSLPRDTYMVLPLGNGYSTGQLAEALGNPPIAYLLPEFPFGWQGSGLAVSESNLEHYLTNIISGLQEDGFTHPVAVLPPGLKLNLTVPWIALAQEAEPEHKLPPDSESGKVVLIPIGHTEQHGFHLPLSTDTLIIDTIGRGTASGVPSLAISLPVMPYGVSTHRQSFAGTLNSGGRAF